MPASYEAEEVTPFAILTEYLETTIEHAEGPVSLPDELVTQFRDATIQDDSGISVWTRILGTSDHTNRFRLDYAAFNNVVAILLHLPYSHQQERLLFAFISTIELIKDTKVTRVALARIKYIHSTVEYVETLRHKIHNKLVHKMMRVLIIANAEDSMRRMAAHILFALVRTNIDAPEIVRRLIEVQNLGPLVDKDDDYLLRLFTANIVRELCVCGMELHEFWPQSPKKKRQKHEDFPLAPAPTSEWIRQITDYLSTRDTSRGFHGDSQHLVSGLLSIDTGSFAFTDRPRGNILAVLSDKCSIVVPGTVSTPLTLLELVLDPKCNYDLDETTSPDFRPDLGDEVIVHIDTGRRGYQVSKGVRNTMDNAELVFSNYGQGRVFADSANLVLTALPPLPRRETSIPGDELSSRQEGRSFRRLNVGMVDLSERSDVEDDVMSDSDVDSLINMRSPFDEQRLRGSQSRYNSRVTQAKLKEASRNQRSKSASFPREGLLRLGDQGSPATPSQSIDPKVLLTRKDEPIPMRPSRSETTTAMPGGNMDRTLSMNVDFASYVDQESHRHPNLSPLGNGTSGDGNRSEGNAKPLPSQNSSPQHSPLLYESDLDPASPVSPLTSRKSAWEKSRGTSARPPPPPLLPRSRAQKSKQRREHSQLQAVLNQYSQTPQNGKTTLVTTRRGSNPVDTAPGTEKRLSASKPSVQTSLKRPQKSQPSASHGIDWDVREMAGEDISAPLTKKPKLGNEAPKQTGRAGEAQLKPDEDPIQIENSGMKSTLQRPKNFIKSSQGLQKKTQPARNHDEFELNADDDEEDSTMPVPKSKQNTTKQVGKTTSQKPKSAASQPPKVVQKKKGAKSRTALKAVNPNTATLASTRARREQPKSSKYVESTDSEPDIKSNQRTEKKIDMAKRDTEESATGKSANDAPRLVMENNADDGHMFEEDRISTEASLLSFGEQSKSLTDSAFPEALKEVHHAMLEQNSVQDRPRSMKIAEESDHHRQVQQHSQAATPKYETLVTASPTRSEKRRTRGQVRELGDRSDLRSERNTNSQDSQAEVGEDHGDPPDQTAESSYPIARSAVQDPRLSFGSKLGQYIQKVAPLRQDTSTAAPQATSISNAKSFITAVKTARSVSPVKKSAVSTTTTGTKRKATQHKRPATRAPKKGATTKETTRTLILTRSPKAQISSPKLPKATDFAGVAYYGHTTAEQVEQPQQERDVLPTTANVLNSYNNDYAHLNILAAIEHQDTTNTIDLTHDSDEETPSTTGDHLDLNLRGDPSTSRDRTVTIPKIQPSVPKVDKKTSREVMKPKAVKNQAAETKHHATSQATTAKTPSISATRAKRMSLSTLKTLLPKNETPTTLEKSTQKVQIVHFGKQGPQNQGVSSPSKESLSSDAAVRRPSGTRKHQAYNKRGTITAVAHTFRNPPKLEPDAAETASDIDLDEQRIIVNDLEDVDESVQSEHAAVSPEEGAGELVPHLPDEVENVSKSASQASRVDENGGPRLQSQEDVELSGWFSPELEAFPHTEVKRYNHAENDSVSPQGMSEIAESSMEDTDTSLHLIRDRPLLHRSDRSIRTQATSKVASISKASQPARRQPAPATMNTKRAPRESLGLNEAVQGQYPKAEKKITTSLFKKSEPKTTASKTLGTSPTLPMNNRQSTGEATDRARQPLTEKSINTEMPNGVQTLPPPPILAHARSAAATIHGKKSYTKLPHPTSPSEVSECTSASLRPSLRARQTKSVADKEFTILENLERGKSVHREAENADVTLVEDSNRGRVHYQQRCPDSSVDSTSPSFWDERCGNFYDERKVWNKGSRVTQTSVREALMEIANNVLFRLETEEKAIELKVNNFAAGGSSILRRYEKTTDELFDHGAKKLVKNARKKRRELESAFNNLELKKTSIREASSSEPAQGHFNANQSSMAKRLKAMIRAEKEQASDDEVNT